MYITQVVTVGFRFIYWTTEPDVWKDAWTKAYGSYEMRTI